MSGLVVLTASNEPMGAARLEAGRPASTSTVASHADRAPPKDVRESIF